MDSTNNPTPATQRRFRFRKRYLLIPLFYLPLFCAVGVIHLLTAGSDVTALRESLASANPGEWDKKITLRVGFFTLGTVRLISNFIPLPPEARAALGAVRNVEVGVFQNHNPRGSSIPSESVAAADRTMSARGWQRTLCVVSDRKLVLVYTPRDLTFRWSVSCCVAVVNEHDLVVVSGRGNAQSLMELAEKKIPRLHHQRDGKTARKLLASAATDGGSFAP